MTFHIDRDVVLSRAEEIGISPAYWSEIQKRAGLQGRIRSCYPQKREVVEAIAQVIDLPVASFATPTGMRPGPQPRGNMPQYVALPPGLRAELGRLAKARKMTGEAFVVEALSKIVAYADTLKKKEATR